jgi:hypothetical protein
MTPNGSAFCDLMDPTTTAGALVYAVAFLLAASLLSRAVRLAVKETLVAMPQRLAGMKAMPPISRASRQP